MHSAKDKLPSTPPRPFAAVAIEPLDPSGPPWSFDGVLRRVIGFSRAATLAPRPAIPRGAANVRVPDRRDRRSTAAFDALRLFVRTLDEPTLTKLGTLMRAGRDGTALGVAHSLRETGAPAVPRQPSAELFDDGAVSLEYVQRGHAIACATQFDLEAGVEAWTGPASTATLDERVWLRFARELAASSVGDWSCLALVGREDRLESLYLSRRNGAWWSFGGVIDRPSAAHVDALRTRKEGPRAVSLPLLAVAGRRCRNNRPAVKRAVLAISARLGCCRLTPNGIRGGA